LNKLKENNIKLGEDEKTKSLSLSNSEMKEITEIVAKLDDKAQYQSQVFSQAHFNALQKLYSWPTEMIGSALHLVRMIATHPDGATHLAKKLPKAKDDSVLFLCKVASTADKSVNAMLAIRAIANLFSRHILLRAISNRSDEIFDAIAAALSKFSDEDIRSSAIGVYINFAIVFKSDRQLYESAKLQLLTSVKELLESGDLSANLVYRSLVIIGTLLYLDETLTDVTRELEVEALLTEKKSKLSNDNNVMQCADELVQLLKPK